MSEEIEPAQHPMSLVLLAPDLPEGSAGTVVRGIPVDRAKELIASGQARVATEADSAFVGW